MKKLKYVLSFFVVLLSFLATAQTDSVSTTTDEVVHKDTVRVGIYVTSIYDLGFAENDFGIDFWVWYQYDDSLIDPKGTMEIVNAESTTFEYGTVERKGNKIWAVQKCRAMIKKIWAIDRFPLDAQTLEVQLEETDGDTSELVYIADVKNSKVDSSVVLSGWKISDFSVRPSEYTYSTTYGDPTLEGSSSYARLTMTTKIERVSKNIFLKLFLGLYVAFCIALAVFFLDGLEIGARTSLAVGALFASVGNKYIVDSSLPDHSSFTIVDKLHDVTFALVFISILMSIVSHAIRKKEDRNHKSQIFDMVCFGLMVVIYGVAHWIIIA